MSSKPIRYSNLPMAKINTRDVLPTCQDKLDNLCWKLCYLISYCEDTITTDVTVVKMQTK